MKQNRANIALYILSVLVLNAVFLYIESLVDGVPKKVVILLHVFFGITQLVYVIRKIFYKSDKGG